MEKALLEILLTTAQRTGDYAATLGFCKGTFKSILQNADAKDYERIEQLSKEALAMIDNIFIKNQIK